MDKNTNIAVVGVSRKEAKFGFKIFRDLIAGGYKVEGVNPADGEVLNRKICRTLKDLEIKPDLVITVVPAQVTERIVEECRELGIAAIWMQPGSDSEAAVQKAREYGIAVTHNSCFMVRQGLW